MVTSPNTPETVERPYLADRFQWAAPGDRQEDAWLVRFCDNDIRDLIFTGPDAEKEAWAAWNRHAPGYNIYVFRLAALSAPSPASGEAMLRAVWIARGFAEETEDGILIHNRAAISAANEIAHRISQAAEKERLAALAPKPDEVGEEGEDSEDYLRGKDDGATFVLTTLADMIGAKDWTHADGSEEWEGDVRGTAYNILVAGGVVDDENGFVARHLRPGFAHCPTCNGDFDQAEWDASGACPECETPKPSLNEPAIPAGMKPWHGGDSAPEDWDEKSVLLRDGTGCVGIGVFRWDHQGFGDDVIAYTPKPRVTAGEKDALISAAFGAIYGPGVDPFEQPERWEFATTVVDAILPHLSTPDARLREENEALRRALVDHNNMLRSACAVADRDGANTNWLTLRGAIYYTLAEHLEITNAARAALGGETLK